MQQEVLPQGWRALQKRLHYVLNDGKGTFTFPDGKKQDFTAKAGDAQYEAAVTHLPENTADTPMDLIVVELKGHAAKSQTMMKK